MPAPHIKYISLMYGLIFLAASLLLFWKTKKTASPSLKNILWALSAFSITKAMSIIPGMYTESILPDIIYPTNKTLTEISYITTITSVLSNLFLFHFGISMLTFKTSMRINYKYFPLLLVAAYASLYFSGIIDLQNAEKISRQSFLVNGALLGSIGCFNLFNSKKTFKNNKSAPLFIIYGSALLFYALTEGIISKPVLTIDVEFLRLLSALFLLSISFFIIDLFEEDRGRRIGYI